MNSLISLLVAILELYKYIVIAHVILSWLVQFNVINTSNRFVYLVGDFLWKATEPVLRPLRRIIPNLGGIDLSPIALLLLIFFVQSLLNDEIRQALVM